MKTLKIVIAIGAMSLMISCGTTSETASRTNPDRGRSNVETTTNTSSRTVQSSRTARAEASVDNNANRINDLERKMELKRMYADLDMSQSQKADFERKWKTAQTSWNNNNPNQAMNNYERIENQDRILKEVLDESQFQSYRQWVRDNAT